MKNNNDQRNSVANMLINRIGKVSMPKESHIQTEQIIREFFQGFSYVNIEDEAKEAEVGEE